MGVHIGCKMTQILQKFQLIYSSSLAMMPSLLLLVPFILQLFVLEIGVSAQSQTASVPKSNADLALNVLQGLQNEGKTNPFFSPTSVFYGLSMLYYGMGDTSRNIMSSSLGLPKSQEKFREELKKLSKAESPSKNVINIIVTAQQSRIKAKYGTRIKQDFRAEPYQWNFAKDPQKAKNVVNKKVAKTFNGALKRFLEPGSVSESTQLLLVNVMHFKSDWKEKFDSETTQEPFQLSGSPPVKVETMYGQFQDIGYFEANNGAQVVSLPFEDNDYEMVFVLPPSGGLQDAGKFLNSGELKKLLPQIMEPGKLTKAGGIVYLPKFKIKNKFDLKDSLSKIKNLGHIFSSSADFSRLVENSVKVDNVKHMAVIDVNSNGVEAAAATGISIIPYSAFSEDLTVQFNRPFFYFIVEKSTNMILFAGIMENPDE